MTESVMSYVLYVGSMVFMLLVHFLVSVMISDGKYSLFSAIKLLFRHGDASGFKWLWKHERFLVYYAFRAAIIGFALANVGKFIEDDIFTRDPFIQYAQPTFWSCLIYIIYDYKRLWDLVQSKTIS